MADNKGSRLRTAWTIAVFFPVTVLFSIYLIIMSALRLVGPRTALLFSRMWGGLVLWQVGCRVTFLGLDNLAGLDGLILAANHSSALDIPILMRLPFHIRYLAKQELFKIPFMGRGMRAVGHLPVYRGQSAKAAGLLKAAAREIKNGARVVIFPEGTRSEDENLLPFKKGGFFLARLAKKPVVPVAIIDSRDRLPSHSLRPVPGRVTVRFGQPIDLAQLPSKDLEDVSRVVKQAVEELLAQGQAGDGEDK